MGYTMEQVLATVQSTFRLALFAFRAASLKHSQFNSLIIPLCLIVLVFPSQCRSDDRPQVSNGSLSGLTLEQLGNVAVTTASKEPEEVWNTPAAISVITQEDIRRSGATSIPEVLRLVPGVEVSRIDSSTWAIGIRGFGSGFSKSVLVLIDGRNVYTPLFAGVNWRVQNLMLEDVERIEVIRGPGGTIWGTNAVNGVINIITKNSKDTRGVLTSVGGGNVNQGIGAFRYGGGNRNLSYRIYGIAFGRAPELHSDRDDFDDWQLGQGGFRVDWDNQKRDTLTVQGDLYKGGIGERENIAYYFPPASLNVDGIEDASGGNILARWQHKINATSDIQVQGYYDRTYRFGPQGGETRNTFDVDFLYHLSALPRQDIIWGLGARWSPSDFIQNVQTVDFQPQHQSDDIYSGFLQDRFTIVSNKLWATLGSKFERNIYTGWETQPTARLLWTPRPQQTIWAAVTRAVRSPSRIDEDLQLTGLVTTNPLPIFFTVAGNEKFVSEKLVGYEIGYRQLVAPTFYIDVATFYNNYNDLTSLGSATISAETSPPPTHLLITVPWANGVRGNTYGAEISPDWKVARWLQLKASYSYLRLDLTNKRGNTDASTVTSDEGSSPQHLVTFQSLFNLPKGFEFDPTFRYVSALPAQAVKAYRAADARLGWTLNRSVNISFIGQNLFQPSHFEFSGDPGPLVGIKRSYYATVTWKRE
jgi:iron complex outermembrane recepter protein